MKVKEQLKEETSDSNLRKVLLGMLPDELTEWAISLGLPPYAGRQIADWIYLKRVKTFEEMTNLSKKHRALLEENAIIGRTNPIAVASSKDGTRKYLFASSSAEPIEAVYIPEQDRATLCISSQVGCKMNCLFCMTGKQGFNGNLSADEILNQLLSISECDRITNIVYMGMGEPLDNVSQVLQSIHCLTHPKALAMSPKRITLSSIGIEPGLTRFLEECTCNMAISLHNALPDERLQIMPIERAMPIEQTIKTLSRYNFSGQRRLTFEYILFGGLNDDELHAKALRRLIAPLDCHVNLIRYHKIPNVALQTTNDQRLNNFCQYLNRAGIPTTIRTSRGEDIAAACGMLSSLHKDNQAKSS